MKKKKYKFIDENTNPIVFYGWYEDNGEIITKKK